MENNLHTGSKSECRTLLVLLGAFLLLAAGCAAAMDRARMENVLNNALRLYERGDYLEASRAYRHAAESGSAQGQYMLGRMYADGKGVPQDPDEHRRWIRMAAESGHAAANFETGIMYLAGDGFEADPYEASYHFMRAAYSEHALSMYYLGFLYALGIGVDTDFNESLRWFRMALAYGIPVDDSMLTLSGLKAYAYSQRSGMEGIRP